MYSVCYFCSILTKFQFPGQIIIKLSFFANISKYSGILVKKITKAKFISSLKYLSNLSTVL
jgi:hypothetical protein